MRAIIIAMIIFCCSCTTTHVVIIKQDRAIQSTAPTEEAINDEK